MNPVIFENTGKSYSGVKILDNINLSFEDKKITAIIGRSGSGKSTLLKLINGLVKPDKGLLKIFGININYNELNVLRLQIGYSVQGTTLFPNMTVFNNITLLGRLNNMDQVQIDDRLNTLITLVDLPQNYLKKYPYELSGGEQQRVGICRAMMLNPKLFLLDEAFGALDPTTKNEIHSELLKIQKTEPRTIILVTHDLNEAFKLADKIIIIEKGIIQQTGSKDEILNSENPFVMKFIKSQTG